jgi:hypothetical protein
MNPLYKELAQIAYDTVLQTMVDGEKTHPDNDWQKSGVWAHRIHAQAHLNSVDNGDTSEDHIAHALTRCAMIKYLEVNHENI